MDIHKAAGIIIKDKKLLVEKSFNREFYVAPGGKVENGETIQQALIRELYEEFTIKVNENSLQTFGTFTAKAAGQEHKKLKMDVFIVSNWEGELIPNNEVEKILWITSDIPKNIKVGSVFEHEVIPRLKSKNLIL